MGTSVINRAGKGRVGSGPPEVLWRLFLGLLGKTGSSGQLRRAAAPGKCKTRSHVRSIKYDAFRFPTGRVQTGPPSASRWGVQAVAARALGPSRWLQARSGPGPHAHAALKSSSEDLLPFPPKIPLGRHFLRPLHRRGGSPGGPPGPSLETPLPPSRTCLNRGTSSGFGRATENSMVK